MPETLPLRTTITDWLIGFVAFCLALAAVIRPQQDLRLFVMVTAAAYFAAGTLRSGAGFSIARSLLVTSGGIIPLLLMRATQIAFTAPLYVPLFVATAILTALAGSWVRSSLRRGKIAAAIAIPAAITGLVVSFAIVAVPKLMHNSNTQIIDRPAPDFAVAMLDGRTLRSSDLHGRVVVVAFWATWCVPCWGELPEVQRVYQQFRGDPRVAIVAIDIADVDGDDQARRFWQRHSLTMPVAMDINAAANSKGAASWRFGRHGLPQIYVLGPDGRVRWLHSGYDASENLADQLANAVTGLLPKG